MDYIIILLILGCIGSFAVSFLSKNEKRKSAANKVLSVLASLLIIYVAAVNYLGGGTGPQPVDPEPDPAVVIVDPDDTEPVKPPADPQPDGGGQQSDPQPDGGDQQSDHQPVIDENGVYDSKEDVSLYLVTYGHLPYNYITKSEAEKLGWSGGSVEQVAPGKCIGGSRFYNNEKKLPEKSGRKYYECDIDTLGYHSRGSRRIIYSNDGLIYYTGDHYETFELLYEDGKKQ